MKIAVAAYPIDWHNRWNEYVGKLRLWVRTAAEQGAELLVFPEYGGLELASLAEEANARDPQRATEAVTARIKDVDDLHGSLAREFKVYICAASCPLRRREGGTVNRVRFFAPDGAFETQDKLMPTPFEREVWGIVPGASARVFETGLGRIGILSGYDVEFPMIARAMVEAGAETLLVPSSTDTAQGHARIRLGAMARALEGQCVVAHAVTVGDADWLPVARKSVGAAAVFGPPDLGFPDDGTLAAGKPGAAGWTHAEVAPDAVRKVREEGAVRIVRDWGEAGPALVAVELVPLLPAPPAPPPEAPAP